MRNDSQFKMFALCTNRGTKKSHNLKYLKYVYLSDEAGSVLILNDLFFSWRLSLCFVLFKTEIHTLVFMMHGDNIHDDQHRWIINKNNVQ